MAPDGGAKQTHTQEVVTTDKTSRSPVYFCFASSSREKAHIPILVCKAAGNQVFPLAGRKRDIF